MTCHMQRSLEKALSGESATQLLTSVVIRRGRVQRAGHGPQIDMSVGKPIVRNDLLLNSKMRGSC